MRVAWDAPTRYARQTTKLLAIALVIGLKFGLRLLFLRFPFAARWATVVLYKMQDEWVTHLSNVDRSELIRGLMR